MIASKKLCFFTVNLSMSSSKRQTYASLSTLGLSQQIFSVKALGSIGIDLCGK